MLLLAAKPESLENAAAGNVPREHLTVHARMSVGCNVSSYSQGIRAF